LKNTFYERFCHARFKIPKYIFFLNEYPMTASGKIQKFKLREISTKLFEEKGVDIV
jgi:fatty-acyl-CoA synthase